MSVSDSASPSPIARQSDEGEAIWFLGVLATIKADGNSTGGQFAAIDHLAPRGAGAPLHVHRREDELFYVTEGELTFWVDGKVIKAGAGAFVYGPRGIPHTFEVTSATARFLVVAQPAGFENFVRALSQPAASRTLPPASVQPPSPERLATLAAEYGIEILGPPGIPA